MSRTEGYTADAVIERQLQKAELGDLRAESLDDVVGKTEQSEGPIWGYLRQGRGTTDQDWAPSEAMRRRFRLRGISVSIAKAKHPARAWLATATAEVWSAHLGCVLGLGLRLPSLGSWARSPVRMGTGVSSSTRPTSAGH